MQSRGCKWYHKFGLWQQVRNCDGITVNEKVNKDAIDEMLAELGAASQLYRPSNIWSVLFDRHMAYLREHGIERFKKSVNLNYGEEAVIFTSLRHFQALSALLGTGKPRGNFEIPADGFRILTEGLGMPAHEIFADREHTRVYGAYTAMLWDYCKTLGDRSALALLEEPRLGEPNYIDYDGKCISQDLARSFIEYHAIRTAAPELMEGRLTIGEIGAGYGRLAYVFARTTDCRYIFFDIPPALYVAQWYFSKLFGEDKVAGFRRHRDAASVQAHLGDRRFAFFTPNQIELFPADYFDLTVNIDSFGEMARSSVTNYLAHMRRIAKPRGFVYLRNLASDNTSRLEDIKWPVPTEADYAFGDGWRAILKRSWPIDPIYFELMYSRS